MPRKSQNQMAYRNHSAKRPAGHPSRAQRKRARELPAKNTPVPKGVTAEEEQPPHTPDTIEPLPTAPPPEIERTHALPRRLGKFGRGVSAFVAFSAALIAWFQIRPIIAVASPQMVDSEESPLYADFTITNQGHLGIAAATVLCRPAKMVYANGDTLVTSTDIKLRPKYSNASINSFSSFTVHDAPLFELTTFSDDQHDRVIVLGSGERCFYHTLHAPGHHTISGPCPMTIGKPADAISTHPRVLRTDLHIDVRYRLPYVPFVKLTSSFRFLVIWNEKTSTYLWEPLALNDPEIQDGPSKFRLCIGCTGEEWHEKSSFTTQP
jgi:hypothetical protein